jgi:hypothetical protein
MTTDSSSRIIEDEVHRHHHHHHHHATTTTSTQQQQQRRLQLQIEHSAAIKSTVRPKRSSMSLAFVLLLTTLLFSQVGAWGSSSSEIDYSVYGNGFTRDWLYDGSTLSFQVLGCVWGMVEDSEEAGCLEDESEDGTYNWYMMANCRRPQVAYSVYAGSGCNSGYFVGSVSSIFRSRTTTCSYHVSNFILFHGDFILLLQLQKIKTVHDHSRSF